MKDLGIYIQVPFCQTKCTYCNFHTGVFSTSWYSPYVDAVCREIASCSDLLRGAGIQEVADAVVDTVYFGGGTPSLLEPGGLAKILEAIRGKFKCNLSEVTLEADPETITPEKAPAWAAAGFNRISLGVQSFQDAELAAAGRMHRRVDIYNATRILREAGLRNISFDLIAGLPHQTDASWDDSIEQLLSLRPEHISIYLMEIDEGSRLGREVLLGGSKYSAGALPEDDAMAGFYERACERLAAAGYLHYEISNWGLPGRESRHNLKYWQRTPYYGFGAGAHSFNGSQRWANPHDPAAYTAAVQQNNLRIEQLESVSREQALDEELFLGLRQLDGIDIDRIETEYGTALRPRFTELLSSGLVEWQGTRLRLAPNRLTVSNEVFVNLLS
jgi:oxygen-independent coproporphyrinogen III oxidase